MRRTADTRAVQRLRNRPRLDPLTVPGCALWLDMLRPSSYTVTGGTTVTSITNLVSGAAWATSATAFPEYEATGINGRPCMKGGATGNGDASNRGLISTEAAVFGCFNGADTAFTVIAVISPASATPIGTGALLSAGNSGIATNSTTAFYRNSATGNLRAHRKDDAAATVTSSGVAMLAQSPTVVTWVCPGTTVAIHQGLGSASSSAFDVGTITPNRSALFCIPDSSPDTFSSDRLGELLLYSRALTDYERLNLAKSLAARWGI